MLRLLISGDGMYDSDEYMFIMYLKWNDQESVDDIKEAFKVFDKVRKKFYCKYMYFTDTASYDVVAASIFIYHSICYSGQQWSLIQR